MLKAIDTPRRSQHILRNLDWIADTNPRTTGGMFRGFVSGLGRDQRDERNAAEHSEEGATDEYALVP